MFKVNKNKKTMSVASFWHSVSFCTDPPQQTTTQQYFLSPQARKNVISPPTPRQTKPPDNSNVLHTFNNNTYADFRTAYKHVLIHSYVIQVI